MTTTATETENPKSAFCPCGGMLGFAGCLEVATFGAHIRPIVETPADAYRAAIRRNYELSKLIAAERDLDARFAIREEQAAVSHVARTLCTLISQPDLIAINDEEFAAAYPTLRLNRKRTAPDRGRWARQQAALR